MINREAISRIIESKKARLRSVLDPERWEVQTRNMEGGEIRELQQSCEDDAIIIEILEEHLAKTSGSWIIKGWGTVLCSVCGEKDAHALVCVGGSNRGFFLDNPKKFCYYCGARMDGDK